MAFNFLIIGAGLAGTVLANRLAQTMDCAINIWDERAHIGGNCFTKRDEETGIMIHEYGPHIFNTDRKEIWDFVNSFLEFKPYVHRVKAMSKGNIYSLPVNLDTINRLFGKSFTPNEAKRFLDSQADKTISHPNNFEEQALRYMGNELYQSFFYGYTKKQWGCEPKELPTSILKRIPIRFNYSDNYHSNIYSGIPVEGYTVLIEKLLDHPTIKIYLNKKFNSSVNIDEYDHIFYTGPIDAFFNYEFGKLGYRTVYFESSIREGDFQGVAQMNFCDEKIPYTRITEHKHFAPWEQHEKSVIFKEYSKETGQGDIPYYPKRLKKDMEILVKYRNKASALQNISFLGRLATYRYLDMHHVIGESMDFSKLFLNAYLSKKPPPVFPNTEKLNVVGI